MQRSKTKRFVAATVCLMMASVTSAPIAMADSGAVNSGGTKPFVAADQSYVILDSAHSVASEQGTFYPTDGLPPDALLVFRGPDGTLPGGLTEAGLARLMEMGAQGLIEPDGTGAVELTPELVALVNGD